MNNGIILIVDDNQQYANKIGEILKKKNYIVDVVYDPITGISEFVKKEYDLVISDLKMAVMNGVQFLETIKGINSEIRTIILTANPSAETEIAALGIEVDRYLIKEIRMDVLLEYVSTILKSASRTKKRKIYASVEENIQVDITTREVKKNGVNVDLTKKEYDILLYFLKNINVAISREDFLKQLWTRPAEDVDERVVDVHIKSLRKKTGCQAIVSLRGYGYKWVE